MEIKEWIFIIIHYFSYTLGGGRVHFSSIIFKVQGSHIYGAKHVKLNNLRGGEG